jgi:hypothetical protein
MSLAGVILKGNCKFVQVIWFAEHMFNARLSNQPPFLSPYGPEDFKEALIMFL